MPTTMESIQQCRKKLRQSKIDFEELNDGDYLVLNGQYRGMKLSDVFVVNPAFIQWLIDDERFDDGVRMAANTIKSDSLVFSGSIMREIITHE